MSHLELFDWYQFVSKCASTYESELKFYKGFGFRAEIDIFREFLYEHFEKLYTETNGLDEFEDLCPKCSRQMRWRTERMERAVRDFDYEATRDRLRLANAEMRSMRHGIYGDPDDEYPHIKKRICEVLQQQGSMKRTLIRKAIGGLFSTHEFNASLRDLLNKKKVFMWPNYENHGHGPLPYGALFSIKPFD